MQNISYISIGDELLKGRILNTNASYVGKILYQNGYQLSRQLSIADDPKAIRDALNAEWEISDIVLMSGGLGPTRDDRTKQTLADMFVCELEWHQPTLDWLEEIYATRGGQINELTRYQALLPTACEAIHNAKGTAPGMLFRRGGKLLISMPGVPFEFRFMLKEKVIPLLQKHYPASIFAKHIMRVYNLAESSAAQRVTQIEDSLPEGMSISFLPKLDGLWLELHAKSQSKNKAQLDAKIKTVVSNIKEAVGDHLYAEDERKLPEILGQILTEKKLTLAVAESLTAGQLMADIASVSGSSTYFKGGITAYHADQKTALLGVNEALIKKHTVVSEEVVKAMAEGVRQKLGADIGMATTGLAETDNENGLPPQVWIAYADKNGSYAKHITLYTDRNANRKKSANYAMIFYVVDSRR